MVSTSRVVCKESNALLLISDDEQFVEDQDHLYKIILLRLLKWLHKEELIRDTGDQFMHYTISNSKGRSQPAHIFKMLLEEFTHCL
ncbi:hypothetical protein H5410_028584 [Solanum commersonii]|uniref:Uncharacterized protein n=1 Tax=Solanum commersonii TaxID=4109 RepID=A0A9J5Z6K0_SOLCO|nr:hypothetical protein H5410_028584 [Solanum commersonii]